MTEVAKPEAGVDARHIQWADLAITVGICLAAVAFMATPFARRFWLPESLTQEGKV